MGMLKKNSETTQPHRRLRIMGAAFLAIACVYWLSALDGIDYAGKPVGGDFINHWTGAKLALAQRTLDIFDLEAFHSAQRIFLGLDFVEPHIWSYPPTMLLIVWPLGFFGHVPAYVVWTLGGLAAALLGARALGIDRAGLFTLALSPAISMNAVAGQTGALVAGLIFAGLGLSRTRPALAGFLFGLCTIKPQLGLLIPVALVMAGRWRCFLASAVTSIALFGLSIYCFGWQAWALYLDVNLPATRIAFESATGPLTLIGASWVMGIRNLGLPVELGYMLQLASALFALSITALVFSTLRQHTSLPNKKSEALVLATLGVGTAITTPHFHGYDLVLAVPALLLAADQKMIELSGISARNSASVWCRRLIDQCWLLPWSIMAWSWLKLPMSPILMTVLLIVFWRWIRAGTKETAVRNPIPPT
jgi:alpha-1,2-mannosyltransferase